MKNTFAAQSGKLSDLREVSVNISGWSYSTEFISRLNENAKGKIYVNELSSSQYIFECLEIREDDTGEILWNAVEEWHHHEEEQEFRSSLGLFRSFDRGEFGGELITPNRGGKRYNGNDEEVVRLMQAIPHDNRREQFITT